MRKLLTLFDCSSAATFWSEKIEMAKFTFIYMKSFENAVKSEAKVFRTD